jgi:tRNA(adenine34) deaminase
MIFNSFMHEAIIEANKALQIDEVPVGAVIVDIKTNQIISRSYNKNISNVDCTAHAEILALKEACSVNNTHRLDECDLYVTLEPCAMCAGAISLARIRRVYYGAEDIKSGGVDNGARVFDNKSCHHKPDTYSGIDSKECEALLKDFFKNKRLLNK